MNRNHSQTETNVHYRVETRVGKLPWGIDSNHVNPAAAVRTANKILESYQCEARVLRCYKVDGKFHSTVHWTPADEIPYLTETLEPTERQLKAEDRLAWADFYA
jgi:hypothetical protein